MTFRSPGVLVALRDIRVWSVPEVGQVLMSGPERRRLETFARSERRTEYLATHSLARFCLEKMFPGTLNEWTLSASGPVEVEGPHQGWVSLSHSGDWVAAAVSGQGRVGIDIECPKSDTDWQAVARRYFPSVEVDWLARLDADSGRRAFYQLWTTKEAYLKALSLNFHDGYRLLEQRAEDLDPVAVETGCALESWYLNRGWYKHEVAFCVFAEGIDDVVFWDSI